PHTKSKWARYTSLKEGWGPVIREERYFAAPLDPSAAACAATTRTISLVGGSRHPDHKCRRAGARRFCFGRARVQGGRTERWAPGRLRWHCSPWRAVQRAPLTRSPPFPCTVRRAPRVVPTR